jgi:hypothetical protein
MKLKVEGYDNLLKDTSSAAVINTDSLALERAKERAQKAAEKNQEIESLKDDVKEIKQLLSQLMDKVTNGSN